jgi:hypothetical protein
MEISDTAFQHTWHNTPSQIVIAAAPDCLPILYFTYLAGVRAAAFCIARIVAYHCGRHLFSFSTHMHTRLSRI